MCFISFCTRGALDTSSRGRSTAALGVMNPTVTVTFSVVAAFTVVASGASPEPVGVSVVKQRTHGTTQRFELRNRSDTPFQYAHSFGSDRSPVPYCRGTDGSVRFCGKKAVVTPEGALWEHESFLAAGKSVRFDALPTTGEVVGVKYWANGSEGFIWVLGS